ncbi:hypothetical protein AAG906_020818 [Vitis piasezkii]
MMEYLLKIKSIVDNLVAIGENITKQDRILYLLAGLGAEYNSFIISVTSGHEPLSLEEIHSMLLTHENRLEQQHITEETNLLQANIATMNLQGYNKKNQKFGQFKTQGRDNQNQQQFNHQNFGRSRRGSFNNHFYSFGSFNNVSGGSNGKPQCQVCGKYGHIAINYYNRFDQTYQLAMNNQLAAMVATPSTVGDGSWYMDTGATHHLTPNLNNLNSHTPFAGSNKVIIGNGNRLNISNIGHSTISSASWSLNLKNILHVPQLTTNLISVKRLCTDNNVTMEFFTNGFVVKDQALKKALLQAPSRRYQDPDGNKLARRTSLTTESHRLPFTLSESRVSQPFALIYSDLWGPTPIVGTNGARYCRPPLLAWFFYFFILYIYMHLSSKNQVISVFLQFKVMIETQFDTKVRILQTDWGGEFQAFTNTLCKFGILHRVSCPSTSQQNGRVERKHKHVAIPLKYWSFAFQYALYLINRLPSSVLNFSSPYKIIYHCLPNYSFLRVYVKCTFIGYSFKHKGYLCLNMSTGKIHISRHVIFYELDFPFAKSSTVQPPCRVSHFHCVIPLAVPTTPISSLLPSSSSPSSELVPISDASVSISSSKVIPIPTAQPPSSHVPLSCHPMTTCAKNDIFKPKIFLSPTETIFHPPCEPNSFKEAKVPEWQQDMHLEFEALMNNKTWVLYIPDFLNTIRHIWWQKDFIKLPVLITLKPSQVFMTQPSGFVDPFKPNFVCKLTKTLYGLKQAPRGFSMSQANTSMFVYCNNSAMLVVLVYVDDIIDLGPLNFFLGIEVFNSGSSLHLSQARYICDLLKRVGLSESKSMASPMVVGFILSIADDTKLEDPTLYRSLVGALQYCTITRPDIAITINKLCQFMHAPTSTHLQAMKRVLHYLKGSLFYGLFFQPSSSRDLIAYTDANWVSCPDDRRSIKGYCIFFGGNLVSWSTSKQNVVSRSSTKSEYKELFVPLFQPPVLYCDNLNTTYLAANPILHSRAKHVEIDYHFVRERVLQKTLNVIFLPFEDQVADILTKALSTQVSSISEVSSQFFLVLCA